MPKACQKGPEARQCTVWHAARRAQFTNESRFHLILIFLPNSMIFKGIALAMKTAPTMKCVFFTRIAVNALDVNRIFGPFRI